MAPRIPPASEEKGESSGGQKIYCYYYRQEGHYSQYPVKSKEKQHVVNMVISKATNVQQVTTWSEGKVAKWEMQEAIRKHVVEWIQQADQRNIDNVKE